MAHTSSHSPARALGQISPTDANYTDMISGMWGVGWYIDDLLSINNPFWLASWTLQGPVGQVVSGACPVSHGPYPRDLTLAYASDVNTPGFALSMDIGILNAVLGEHIVLETRLFGKQTIPAFKASWVSITRSIHATSAVDSNCKNISIWQVSRIGCTK